MAPRTFFPGIQALRAVAAIFVLIEHALFVANQTKGMPYRSWYPLSYGLVGIMLFFAISGFVIALNRKKPVGEFVLRRLLRIYPSYWLAIPLAAAMLYPVRDVTVIPSEVLLFPSAFFNYDLEIPYWTLVFEMAFYALAAAAFAMRLSDRVLTAIALLWIAAISIAGVTTTQFPAAWILLSPWTQLFPMGLLCGIHFERLRSFGRWPFILAGIIAAAANYNLVWGSQAGWKTFLVGVSCTMTVLATADLEVPKLWRRFGDASYGMYLLHYPPMFALALLVPQSEYWGFLGIGLAAGLAYGLFDHWLHKRLTAIIWSRA